MKQETKKQVFALFILFMFIGSTAAISLLYAFVPANKETKLLYSKPLSNSEEAPYLQKNYVIVKYFWNDNCQSCNETYQYLWNAFQMLKGKFVIESINTDVWPDSAKQLGIENVPSLYIKGYTIEVLDKNITEDKIVEEVCSLYFKPIDECNLV